MFYVYLLECSDGTYYTGYTKDVEKRLETHNSGKGAKYTKTRLPVKLKGVRIFTTQREAMQKEILVKKMPRRDKLKFFTAQYK
jgi:putative endonuclease